MKQNIKEQLNELSIEEMTAIINNNQSRKMWYELINYINQIDKVKMRKGYSKDVWQPGWNLKYKKNNKALLTMYPQNECFSVLIVLGNDNFNEFINKKDRYTEYVVKLFEDAKLYNGTKWLMIEVKNDLILKDVKNLINIKANISG
jgi:hypothetical protein